MHVRRYNKIPYRRIAHLNYLGIRIFAAMIATEPYVKAKFEYFNSLCFEGILPPIPIVMVKARSFLGKVEYVCDRGFFGRVGRCRDFRMKISVSYDLGEAVLEDVILHEMIHYYIAVNNIRDSSAHGHVFREMMASINGKYGRNITVRHRSVGDSASGTGQPATDTAASSASRLNHICVSTFSDGKVGVTVCSESKVRYMKRVLPRCFSLEKMEWYTSKDAFFNRFPRARTPKIYKITRDELDSHLADARVCRQESDLLKWRK